MRPLRVALALALALHSQLKAKGARPKLSFATPPPDSMGP
jgi:hypothetical protein